MGSFLPQVGASGTSDSTCWWEAWFKIGVGAELVGDTWRGRNRRWRMWEDAEG